MVVIGEKKRNPWLRPVVPELKRLRDRETGMLPQVQGQPKPYSELYLSYGVRSFFGVSGGSRVKRRGTDGRCISFFSVSALKQLKEEAVYFG